MKSYTDTQKTWKLELTETEAYWLRGYMQNKLIDNESKEDSRMRSRFFNAVISAEPQDD